MSRSSKRKQFRVRAVVSGVYSTVIGADSLEDALEQSKALKTVDFVQPVDDFDDGEMEIHSVEREGWYPEIK